MEDLHTDDVTRGYRLLIVSVCARPSRGSCRLEFGTYSTLTPPMTPNAERPPDNPMPRPSAHRGHRKTEWRGQGTHRHIQATRPSYRVVGNLPSLRNTMARMPFHFTATLLSSLVFCDLLCAVRGESVSSQFTINGAQIEATAGSTFHVSVSGSVQVRHTLACCAEAP